MLTDLCYLPQTRQWVQQGMKEDAEKNKGK